MVTSPFGSRINPVLQTYEALHNGIDLAADMGTPALAVADGLITEIGNSPTFGLFVKYEIEGGYTVMYAHLSEAVAAVGEAVPAGGVVALTGNSGLATGPHLHYSVWKDGALLDPIGLIIK